MPGYVATYLGRGEGNRAGEAVGRADGDETPVYSGSSDCAAGMAGARGWGKGDFERPMSVGSSSTTRSFARPKIAFGRRVPDAVGFCGRSFCLWACMWVWRMREGLGGGGGGGGREEGRARVRARAREFAGIRCSPRLSGSLATSAAQASAAHTPVRALHLTYVQLLCRGRRRVALDRRRRRIFHSRAQALPVVSPSSTWPVSRVTRRWSSLASQFRGKYGGGGGELARARLGGGDGVG